MLIFLDQKFYSPPSGPDKRLKVSKKVLFYEPDATVYEPLSFINQSTPLSTCSKSCK